MVPVRTIAARFSPLLNFPWTCSSEQAADRKYIGDQGERISARWLTAKGCRILYRNYKAAQGGELDLVVRDRKVLCFTEVKTRTNEAFGRPALAVNLDKQELLVRGATAWMRMLGWPEIAWRFDVMEVLLIQGEKPRVNWIRGAFSPEEMKAGLSRRGR